MVDRNPPIASGGWDAAGDAAGFIAVLPDLPLWVEARGLLLSGRGRSRGVSDARVPTGVIVSAMDALGIVVGCPPTEWIAQLAEQADEILVPPESLAVATAALPGWDAEEAVLHTLPGGLPADPGHGVRLLGSHELPGLRGLDDELREELEDAFTAGAEIAAALADDVPVAFCYAGAVSERLWDVSIDTLASHRRRGFAARAAAFAMARMGARGRRPVWGALRSNAGSLGLAAHLGFEPVDRIFVLSEPEAPAR